MRSLPFPLRHALILAAFTAGACTGPGAPIEERTGSDGVREVLNHHQPPYPIPWEVEEVARIGTAYGDTTSMLGRPTHFTVLPDGSAIILDSQPLHLRVYGPDGSFQAAFGRQGAGPVDLQRFIRHLGPLGADRFELWSGHPIRRQVFDLRGTLHEVWTLAPDHPFVEGSRPSRVGIRDDAIWGWFTYAGRQTGITPGRHELRLTDWGGSLDRLVFSVQAFDWESLGPQNKRQFIGMAQAVSDFLPQEHLLVPAEGPIYFGEMDEDWVRAFDTASGKEILRFRLVREIPEAIADSTVEKTGRVTGDPRIAEGMRWFQEHYWYVDLTAGPDGEVWVQRNGYADPRGLWTTDVFTRRGHYLGRIDLPFVPAKMQVHGQAIWALTVGEQGEPILARYRLKRNP